jgi:sulfhydrogenase subunit delta
VSTEKDLERLKGIRDKTDMVVALGDCAINGCVQAMKNGQVSLAEKLEEVYGVDTNYYDVLEAKGLSSYVEVDLKIPGCPIEKEEFLSFVTSLLHGNIPEEIDYPVCVECKLKEYPCVIIEEGKPCLGPLIRAGCKARCPGLGLDCIGCRGIIPTDANIAREVELLLEKGYDLEYISNRLSFFGGGVEILKELNRGGQV